MTGKYYKKIFRIFQLVLGISIIVVSIFLGYFLESSLFGLSVIGIIFILAGAFSRNQDWNVLFPFLKQSPLLYSIIGSITIVVAVFITGLAIPWFHIELQATRPNIFFWVLILLPWFIGIGLLISAFRMKSGKR